MSKLVKVSGTDCVNPKHVVRVVRNPENLEVYVVMIGAMNTGVKSDHSFDDTIKMLSGVDGDEEK